MYQIKLFTEKNRSTMRCIKGLDHFHYVGALYVFSSCLPVHQQFLVTSAIKKMIDYNITTQSIR